MIETVAHAVLVYVGLVTAAWTIHLITGMLIEGPREVRRQTRESWDQTTPARFAVLHLTLGLFPRRETDE